MKRPDFFRTLSPLHRAAGPVMFDRMVTLLHAS